MARQKRRAGSNQPEGDEDEVSESGAVGDSGKELQVSRLAASRWI